MSILYKDLPFEMPRVKAPVFPDNEVNLKDFGAVGDGMHLCTEAFAKAIDALDEAGSRVHLTNINVPKEIERTREVNRRSQEQEK